MSEKLERVRDFGELREGMIVVTMDCHACGKSCRGMCVGIVAVCFEPSTGLTLGPLWEVVPPCYIEADETVNGIDAEAIATGEVFRVVDGLESPQTTERAKERVR